MVTLLLHCFFLGTIGSQEPVSGSQTHTSDGGSESSWCISVFVSAAHLCRVRLVALCFLVHSFFLDLGYPSGETSTAGEAFGGGSVSVFFTRMLML